MIRTIKYLVNEGLPLTFIIFYCVGLVLYFTPLTHNLFIQITPYTLILVFAAIFLHHKKYAEPKLDKMKWTMAPLTIYLGIKGKLDKLEHHNYFLGNNFDEYAIGVFKNQVSFRKPYYYANLPSRNNPEYAPEGHESLFILCPSPDLRFKSDWSDSEEIAQNIINDLSERTGYNLNDMIVSKTILTPAHWENMFNLYKGSGLGLAHDMSQIGWFRPSNKDEKLNNVYYVGASTIPGTGLPMTVISSKLTTERLLSDLKSGSE